MDKQKLIRLYASSKKYSHLSDMEKADKLFAKYPNTFLGQKKDSVRRAIGVQRKELGLEGREVKTVERFKGVMQKYLDKFPEDKIYHIARKLKIKEMRMYSLSYINRQLTEFVKTGDFY